MSGAVLTLRIAIIVRTSYRRIVKPPSGILTSLEVTLTGEMVVRVHVHRQTDWSGPLTAALVVNLCSWCHATRPNVLMLVADDLRPEIGAFGVDTAVTPRIDKLAKESLVLTRNYVQQAVCGPTRASILTGRRPDTLRTITHSLPTYWRERAGNFTTIPQLFREVCAFELLFLQSVCASEFALFTLLLFCCTEWVVHGELW